MREILFRGFARKANGSQTIEINGEKIRGQWIYWNVCGDLVNKSNTKREWFKFCLPDGRPHDLDMIVSIAAFGLLVIETIGQYTGLTDKNERKIFEGDIVDCWSEGVNAQGTVQQRRDGLWIIYPAWQKHIMWGLCPDEYSHTTVEVIGNIHNNPELIKT